MLAGCAGGDDTASTTSATTTAAAGGPSFTNPVWEENFPDPFVMQVDDEYYAYATNGENGNVPAMRSDDLVEWKQVGDVLPKLGAWADIGKTWAPAVLRRADGKFILYYTAASSATARQCIGRAVADSARGPFVDESKQPLVCQVELGGSIDAEAFDDDGQLYLLWKNDGNAVGEDTFIWSQLLSDDGLTLTGKAAAQLVKQDAGWEGPLVEAPTLWKRDGRYYLFFSANAFYNETYAVGYATCDGPLGPCKDAPENPILKTTCNAVGPGHQSLIEDDDGETWIAYHAWPPDAVNSEFPGRVMWIDRVEWKGGKPDIVGPTCEAQPVP